MSVTDLAITFSREELVVLAELCDGAALPMLGERPLGALRGEARDAVLDVATRSLLARGVLSRADDTVGVARAAAGLIGIVSSSSLRAQVVVSRDGTHAAHTVYALPYAAVDTSIDENGNHRFAPFATADLLLHVGGLTGLLPDSSAPADIGDGAGGEVSLPYGALRLARAALGNGLESEAATTLVDAGLSGATAELVLDLLRSAPEIAAVQIVHHPTASTTAGGEVAWIDAGERGTWLVPTLDQPFARLSAPGTEDGPAALPSAEQELDAVIVTLSRTTRQAILADLLSVLPTSS